MEQLTLKRSNSLLKILLSIFTFMSITVFGDADIHLPGKVSIPTSLSIGITSEASTKSLLDMQSTTKGFLPPRMTTTQQNAITSIPEGLRLYDSTLHYQAYYNGTSWLDLASLTGSEALTNKTMSGSSNTFTNISLTSAVTGVLPVANGGCNNASLAMTAGGLLYTDGTKCVNVGAGTSTNILQSNGASPPTWIANTASVGYDTPNSVINLGLTTSVSASAMTVALKQKDGTSNPAAGGSKVSFAFLDTAVPSTSRSYTTVDVTGALSLVISSGATLGLSSGVASYIWVYAVNNGGTVDLCVMGGDPIEDNTVASSTTMSAGATSSGVLYCGGTYTNKTVRLIGRILETQTTAGTYAATATEVYLRPVPKLNTSTPTDAGAHVMSATSAYVFTVTAANATVGAVYSNNSQTFLVSATIAAGVTLNSSGTGTPAASGTLTKVSGTGDATITFSSRTITGVPVKGTNTTDRTLYWRHGRRLYVEESYLQTGAGTAGSGDYVYTTPVPATHVMDLTNFSPYTVVIGNAQGKSAADIGGGLGFGNAETMIVRVIPYDTTHFRLYVVSLSINNMANSASNFGLAQANFGFSIKYDVPITGWFDYGP